MAGAALPTAARQMEPGDFSASPAPSPSRASRTQRRPSTQSRAACRRVSSNSRRGSLEGPSSAPAHHFELAPLAACELGGIGTLVLEALEVLWRHVARDVFAREARGVELLDARILVLAGGDEIVEVLVHQPV